ncbi:unnamed protein product, partial [Tenebrio molitor]
MKTIALLIEKGASVNAVRSNNETPLHLASRFGDLETVELRIKKGASVREPEEMEFGIASTCCKPTFQPW